MDSKELRGLVEAYSEVYAPQEVDEATAMAKRGYDEAPIRQKIAKSTGGGEAADRATSLENRPTYGDAKKAKARQELARKQRGDFRKTTSSSPGLHGYAHKSDDAGVKAKQAARGAQRGALTPAEKKQFNREEFDIFDIVLEFLQVEGFAETLEEAEWMMANIIDEEAIAIIVEASCEDDEEEMKKGKKSKKSEEDDEDEEEEELDEALTGERIKKVIRKPGGTNYTRMHSADPAKRPTKRGGRGERGASKQHDFGAADRGAGNKAARRAGTYQDQNEEFVGEGKSSRPRYSGGRGVLDQERRDEKREASAENMRGHTAGPGTITKNPKKLRKQKAMGEFAKEAFEAWLDEAMTNYEKNRKRAAQRAAARNAARDQGKTGAVPGVGYVTPRRERETWTDESGKTRHAKGL